VAVEKNGKRSRYILALTTMKTDGRVMSVLDLTSGLDADEEMIFPTILSSLAELPKLTKLAIKSPLSSVIEGSIFKV